MVCFYYVSGVLLCEKSRFIKLCALFSSFHAIIMLIFHVQQQLFTTELRI